MNGNMENDLEKSRTQLINKRSELKEKFLREEISAEEYTSLKDDLEKELETLEESEGKKKAHEDKKDSEKTEEKKELRHKTISRNKKKNVWMHASMILGVLFIISMLSGGFKDYFGTGIGSEKAGEQAVEFINTNLLQGGSTADLESVSEAGDLYKININVGGQEFESYMTKDGKYLFPQGIDLNEEIIAPSAPSKPVSQPSVGSRLDVNVDDDPSIGPEDALVTIVEFSDFQCPFCARVVPTVKQVLKEYEGKVRFVFRDFPLSFHSNAQKAAEAAECADEQGKFWEYHDILFENQQSLDVDSLKRYAKDIGLDSSKFDNCLDSGKYESEVKKDLQDGSGYGVSGTPAFFINGRELSGAQPFSAFQQIIEEELAK